MSFEGEVWAKFKAIDVTPMMEKTGAGIGYVSWSKLWSLLMTHYPATSYKFEEKRFTVLGANGPVENVEVWCELRIIDNDSEESTTRASMSRSMWLPVMQSYGQFLAIDNPTPRDISDTRMRCLVKCAAMFGLGISAWSGDDYKPDPALERLLAFCKKPAVYRMMLWKTAMCVKEAFLVDDQHTAYETLEEVTNEEEKNDLWIAETKGGFFSQDEKTWIRALTVSIKQEQYQASAS
jgi:hypothetical protein